MFQSQTSVPPMLQSQTLVLDLGPRPQSQTSVPDFSPRPQPQTSVPDLSPMLQSYASVSDLGPRPQSQTSVPGLGPRLQSQTLCSRYVHTFMYFAATSHKFYLDVSTDPHPLQSMFEPYLKSFFIHSSDPTHIRLLKVGLIQGSAIIRAVCRVRE